jgi:Cysteine-rich secretory protein family
MIRRRLVLPIVLPILLLVALAPTASATTTLDLEYRLLGWINQARLERNLVPLRSDSRVWDLAGDRAAIMASRNVLSHTVAGNVGSSLTSRGIRWYMWGDAIAYTTRSNGSYATSALFALWKGSKAHWDLLMSPDFNYIGIGLAYKSSTKRTFGDVVLIDGPDRTRPGAAMVDVTRDGDDVRWTWRGWDPPLQKRTSGLATFQVQYRRDDGSFVTLATATVGTAWSYANRAHGHTYGMRIRAKDRAGNVGAWSSELRTWVP